MQDSEHLVLAVRRRPKISWAKRFAYGDAVVIGPDVLRFSQSELKNLLCNHNLTDTELADLEQVLAGWPAGYGFLRARTSAETAAITDERIALLFQDVESYLCEEVSDELPAELQEFLLQLSAVSDFSCDVASWLTGRNDASRELRKLMEGNLFVIEIYREHGEAYAYQFRPAFRRFLQQ